MEPIGGGAAQLLNGGASERLIWAPGGLSMIEKALVLGIDRGAGDRAVEGLLRLSSPLRGRLGSPSAADALLQVLQRAAIAAATIGRLHGPKISIDARNDFVGGEGRAVAWRAPMLDGDAPSGAVPLKSLIAPGRGQRPRIKSR